MKKRVFIAMISALCAVSCLKYRIPDSEGSLQGRWALLQDQTYTDHYLEFGMGKCYTYKSLYPHIVLGGCIWGCGLDDFQLVSVQEYAVIDDCLVLGDVNVGHLTRRQNNSLAIGSSEYAPFTEFNPSMPDGKAVTGLKLDFADTVVMCGASFSLHATVTPKDFKNYTIVWRSANPEVATVDRDGNVQVVDCGATTIFAATDDGSHEAFCVVYSYRKLSEKAKANCYVVSYPGLFCFDASEKGGSGVKIEGGYSASLLWSTAATAQAQTKPLLLDVEYEKGYIYFATTYVDGNAVVALRDKNGNVLWSWHVWVCGGFDPDRAAHTYAYNAGRVMDRNLGALSPGMGSPLSFGLLYQWGRKDPFPPAVSQIDSSFVTVWPSRCPESVVPADKIGDQVAYSIAHPTHYISRTADKSDWADDASADSRRWNTESKSMYDPCPAGWMIPYCHPIERYENVWERAAGGSLSTFPVSSFIAGDCGFNVGGWMTGRSIAWYPLCGVFRATGSGCVSDCGMECIMWTASSSIMGARAMVMSWNPRIRVETVPEAYAASVRCIKEQPAL